MSRRVVGARGRSEAPARPRCGRQMHAQRRGATLETMGDPFRNPLASMSARVEALEHENRELRAQITVLQNETEARRLRRGRGSWLLAGLVASFFPLVAGPLFFTAPKVRLPA